MRHFEFLILNEQRDTSAQFKFTLVRCHKCELSRFDNFLLTPVFFSFFNKLLYQIFSVVVTPNVIIIDFTIYLIQYL